MSYLAMVYVVYVALSLLITVGVGQHLFRHGRLFLIDVFRGERALADSVNHLLLTGYYLTNIALDLFLLKSRLHVTSWIEGIELLSQKAGTVMIILGAMHFLNITVLLAVRRYRRLQESTVPKLVLDVVEFLDDIKADVPPTERTAQRPGSNSPAESLD